MKYQRLDSPQRRIALECDAVQLAHKQIMPSFWNAS